MAASPARSGALLSFLLPGLTWKPNPSRTTSIASFRGAADRSITRRNGSWARLAVPPTLCEPPRSLRPLCRLTKSQSASSSRLLPQLRRTFHNTAPRPRDHHFDTLKFVQRLKNEGLSEEQAVAMMRVLSDVIEESIQNLARTMVPREDQEKVTYTQKVDFAKLRSELLSADSTESSLTRASHERLTNDLAKLNSRLRDEISRTQASVRLDLNLEKGRIREEANVQELKIKETETRIEQEVAGLRERVEGVKFSTLQWLM
ncbi:MAG: hypothetical protein M1839_005570 [Geoglossum umbratile]|nr:MAG: hypothetical protein M1839_005570 [Geoglossum umbratile]